MPIGTIREIPVDFDQITMENVFTKALKSLVRLSRTREGLLIQVKGGAEVKTECVDCLDEFFLPVYFKFDELYEFPSRKREETDLVLPADGYIDLSEIYREFLILAIPIRCLCQEECKGLCEVCGTNLNHTTCEHHPENEEPDQQA